MKKILLSLTLFLLLLDPASALSRSEKDRLFDAIDHTTNYQAFIDLYNEIADAKNYKTADGKRDVKRLVKEVMAEQPYTASLILDFGDYWKFVFLLDNGWDVLNLDDDGNDLLAMALDTHHKPLVIAVLKAGGWKLVPIDAQFNIKKSVRRYFERYKFNLPSLERIVVQWIEDPYNPQLEKLSSDDFKLESPGLRTGSDEGSAGNSPMPPSSAGGPPPSVPPKPSPPAPGSGAPKPPMAPTPLPGAPRPPTVIPPVAPMAKFDVYPVPFATNRARDKSRQNDLSVKGAANSPESFFTYELGSQLIYGIAEVTIPKNQKRGNMQLPGVMTWDKRDSARFMTLDQIQLLSKENFFGSVEAIHTQYLSNNPKAKNYAGVDDIFIYVHGFNVDYEYAMMKTAQMMRDMRYPGVSMAYTWPARAVSVPFPQDFKADVERAKLSEVYIKEFITDVVTKFPGRKIHIVAHSLGTRILTRVLVSLSDIVKTLSENEKQLQADGKLPQDWKRLGEIILAAPAVDAKEFMYNLVKPVSEIVDRVSIIASDDDVALKLQTVAGDSEHPLGLRKDGRAALSPLVTNFDVSPIGSTTSTDHSVYSEQPAAINLMADLIKDRLPIEKLEEKGYIVPEKQENFFDLNNPKAIIPYWILTY